MLWFWKPLTFFVLFIMLFINTASAFDEEHIQKLEERIAEIESFLDAEDLKKKKGFVRIGGAGRIQYNYKDWDNNNKKRGGDLSLDLFRLNFSGANNNLTFSSEYRFYPTSSWHGPHHAWVGYKITENLHTEFGIHQVPFGLQPYASHSFWFSGAYYLGYEDDYDLGLKFLYDKGPWSFTLGAYKNEELGNAGSSKRYSIDMISNADGGFAGAQADGNQESNQLNLRSAYTFGHGSWGETSVGASAQIGKIYNNTLQENGDRWAGAVHLNGQYGRWNIQLEWIRYDNSPKYPSGFDTDIMTVGAYASSWGAPTKGDIGIFNMAYTSSIHSGLIDSLTYYFDNTLIEPKNSRFPAIWQNSVGCIAVAGPIFSYLDIISGENMIFSGGNMVDGNEGRTTRVNMNVGYYF